MQVAQINVNEKAMTRLFNVSIQLSTNEGEAGRSGFSLFCNTQTRLSAMPAAISRSVDYLAGLAVATLDEHLPLHGIVDTHTLKIEIFCG